jgi:hypothetical protein
MPQIQLSNVQSAAEHKFGDLEVVTADGDTLVFQNPMRIPKERRQGLVEVFDLEKRVETNPDDDKFDLFQAAFKIVAKTPEDFEKLAAAVGDDPATWQELFHQFEAQTDPEKA